MRISPLLQIGLLATALGAAGGLAHAQANLTPQQIQGQIAGGQQAAALGELNAILQAHPQSGVAWYLTAEAQDASGNEAAARAALANAQQYAPGLPFAQPAKVAELQAHLNGGDANNGVTNGISMPVHHGMSPLLTGLIILGVLFFAVRMLFRSRRRYPAAYPPGYTGAPNYGPGGMGGGMGGAMGGMGGGIGGGLLGGLAAGAGFAAGERVIDDMMGGGRPAGFDQPGNDPGIPDRDDGLTGAPDWNNNQDDNNGIDPGSSW